MMEGKTLLSSQAHIDVTCEKMLRKMNREYIKVVKDLGKTFIRTVNPRRRRLIMKLLDSMGIWAGEPKFAHYIITDTPDEEDLLFITDRATIVVGRLLHLKQFSATIFPIKLDTIHVRRTCPIVEIEIHPAQPSSPEENSIIRKKRRGLGLLVQQLSKPSNEDKRHYLLQKLLDKLGIYMKGNCRYVIQSVKQESPSETEIKFYVYRDNEKTTLFTVYLYPEGSYIWVYPRFIEMEILPLSTMFIWEPYDWYKRGEGG